MANQGRVGKMESGSNSCTDGDAWFFGECVLVSGEQPEAKPHTSIFRTACEMIGVAACEAVMVGDSLVDDIQGGNNAGLLATVWVSGGGGSEQTFSDGQKPSHTIATVLDLESVLSQIKTS